MGIPGETLGFIQAGPHRGILAIHLNASKDQLDEKDLPRLIEQTVNEYGLYVTGKAFIVVRRFLTEPFIQMLRGWGAYLVADGLARENHEWFKQCNHWTVRLGADDYLSRKADSIVYEPDVDLTITEPTIGEVNFLTPKYLLIEEVNDNVMDFIKNSAFAWGVQNILRPLCMEWDVPLKLEEKR